MNHHGAHWSHVDNQLGLDFASLDQLSIRQQREIVKQRAEQLQKLQRLKYRHQHRVNSISHGAPTPVNMQSRDRPQVVAGQLSFALNPTTMEGESPERTKDSMQGVSHDNTDMDLLSGGADVSTTAASPLKLTKKSTFGKPSHMLEGGTERRLDSIYSVAGSNINDPLHESSMNVHHASMTAA
jgi:hypothetical protein